MINADNSIGKVKVNGELFDIVLELNGILDSLITCEPDMLLGTISAWTDRLQEYTPKRETLFDAAFSLSTKYLREYESEDITPDE